MSMFAPVPNWEDCRSPIRHQTVVYVGWSRYAAMADYITRQCSLEADTSFTVPHAVAAPANTLAPARIVVTPLVLQSDEALK